MLAAEFNPSWKGDGGEKVGERRARKARELAATPRRAETPTENISISSRSTKSSSTGPTEKISLKSIPLRNKLSAVLRLPLRHTFKKHPESEKPVFKIERVPTLLQQKGREPDRISRPEAFVRPFNDSNVQPVNHRPRTLRISNQDAAEEFCQAYDEVKERIYALQAIQSEINVLVPRAPSPTSFLRSSSPEQTDYAKSWTTESHYDETEQVRYCSPSRTFISNQGSPHPIDESPAVLESITSIGSSSRRTDSPVPFHSVELVPHRGPLASSDFVHQDGVYFHDYGVLTPRFDSPTAVRYDTKDYSSTSVPQACPNEDNFIRLLRRMEAAAPKVVLDRLREDWAGSSDPLMREELQLEKQLWTLVAVESAILNVFARSAPHDDLRLPSFPISQYRNIIEIGGSLADLYHTASRHIESRVVHLIMPATIFETNLNIPRAVTQHRMPNITSSGGSDLNWSLPYTSLSVHHIRASRLASSVPEPHLSAVMADCFRILKPGGTLELHIVDAIPDRGTIGPKLATWLEERLLSNLERELRCSRPCHVLPRFAAQVGFVAPYEGPVTLVQYLKLPAVADESKGSIASNIACIVVRQLWRDNWGIYVSNMRSDVSTWWWDDREILEECLEWKTVWDVGTMLVRKDEHH